MSPTEVSSTAISSGLITQAYGSATASVRLRDLIFSTVVFAIRSEVCVLLSVQQPGSKVR